MTASIYDQGWTSDQRRDKTQTYRGSPTSPMYMWDIVLYIYDDSSLCDWLGLVRFGL